MNLYEEFADARDKKTYNKFYVLGRVQGIGTDSYGRKRFIVFIREAMGDGRYRPMLNLLRHSSFTEVMEYLDAHQEEFSKGGLNFISRLRGIYQMSQDRKSEESQGTYLSIEYGDAFLPSDTRINDMVEVIGHIEAYSYRGAWDKGGYIFQLVADKIQEAEPVLSKVYGPEAGGFSTERPTSFVVLKGSVQKKTERASTRRRDTLWYRLLLKVDTDTRGRRPSDVWVQYSSNMRVNDVKAKEGDTVQMYGTFSSTRKEVKSDEVAGPAPAGREPRPEYRHYINVIVDDMGIVGNTAAGFGNFGMFDEPETEPVKKRE